MAANNNHKYFDQINEYINKRGDKQRILIDIFASFITACRDYTANYTKLDDELTKLIDKMSEIYQKLKLINVYQMFWCTGSRKNEFDTINNTSVCITNILEFISLYS